MALLAISCTVPATAVKILREHSGDDYYINNDGECICHIGPVYPLIITLKPSGEEWAVLTLVFPSPAIDEVIRLLKALGAKDFRISIVDNQED